ncbi:futalosine hydrolase [Pedobacter sp.]|uniref:futalosine hydrolase n=1 Tax=Pedobacter sp. TaxID=1411316 RepID=UPI003D7FC5F3
MKILIVAATLPEIAGLHQHFELQPAPLVQTTNFDTLVTGVGMTATAFALGRQLTTNYNLVLNIGIAGCFDTTYPLGTVLHITADEFSELGAEDKDSFIPIETLGFGKSKYTSDYATPAVSSLPKVHGITVNTVHGNKQQIEAIEKRLQPVTESMEGAAVFYACEQAGIPCLQVRSISNYVEERNKANWNIGLALKNLNEWAIDYLTNA